MSHFFKKNGTKCATFINERQVPISWMIWMAWITGLLCFFGFFPLQRYLSAKRCEPEDINLPERKIKEIIPLGIGEETLAALDPETSIVKPEYRDPRCLGYDRQAEKVRMKPQ